MNKLKNLANKSADYIRKHAPTILTYAGIGGFVTTVVMAIKATPKALDIQKEFNEDTTNWEKVKALTPVYIPTIIVGASSITCVIAANALNVKRFGALAAAYKLTETAYKEYKDGVIETVGEKKEQAIRDKIAEKKIKDISDEEPLEIDDSKTLCLDLTTGGYFMSDKMSIEKKINELNATLLVDGYVSLNDFREALGNQPMEIGDKIGWHCEFGLISVSFSSQLAPSGRPCLTISYDVSPGYDFDKMF